MWQLDPAGTYVQVAHVLRVNAVEVSLKSRLNGGWKERDAITVSFPASHGYLVGRKVEILDPESGALEEPQAGPVEQDRHQPRRAAKCQQDGTRLVP
jgi:hypothetical protein